MGCSPGIVREMVVMSIIHKLSVEGLVPRTINTYVSAVRFMLNFTELERVCSARTAIELQYRFRDTK